MIMTFCLIFCSQIKSEDLVSAAIKREEEKAETKSESKKVCYLCKRSLK